MNKIEAIRAMCDGKKVCCGMFILEMNAQGDFIRGGLSAENLNHLPSIGWQIYEEPKPKVTYDEAVAAKAVKIYWPPESIYEEPKIMRRWYGWSALELLFFDLADRKGYRMEVVE